MLFEGVPKRNGFPTFASKTDGPDLSDTRWGYLTWLNDQAGPPCVVYAGDVGWRGGYAFESNALVISEGLSAPNPPYTYGPDVALVDYSEAKCIWTDQDPLTYDLDVYGDASWW